MRISGVSLCNFKTAFTEIRAPPATKTNIVPTKIWSEIIDDLVKAVKVLNEITLLCNFPSGSNIKIWKNIDIEQFVLIPPPKCNPYLSPTQSSVCIRLSLFLPCRWCTNSKCLSLAAILVFTSKIRDYPTCLRFSRRGNGYFHCGFRFYIILGYLFNIITPNLNAHTSSNEKEKKIKKDIIMETFILPERCDYYSGVLTTITTADSWDFFKNLFLLRLYLFLRFTQTLRTTRMNISTFYTFYLCVHNIFFT